MSCERIQPNLLDYGKGRLTGREAVEVRGHLADCAECRQVLSEELLIAGMLASVPVESPTRDMWATVAARTVPTKTGLLPWLSQAFGINRLRLAALAGLAVLALVVMLFSNQPKRDQMAVGYANPDAVAVKWSDDPTGRQLDAVVSCIDKL